MVGTGPPPHLDHVLARVSLVNFHGEQIYDSYVQPPPTVRVHDYRTAVSGIRPHHLRAGVARPFGDVQRDVARVLAGRVLVGHALRNDLSVLMLAHPKRDVRDTSRYAKFRVESKGKPPALRNLARSELGLEIQMGEHSSLEDARVAMLLFAKEKRGFEEENRRVFGRRKGPVVVVGGKADAKMGKGDTLDVEGESEEEVEEDLDTLDGEEDEELEDGVPVVKPDAQPKGKKRKKKKRTKRN
jgi:RNA exonuclease 4